MNIRKKQKQETRQKIIAAAQELFLDRGFDNTSIGQIALAANVAYGTVYYHFNTKENILHDMTLNLLEEQISAAKSFLPSTDSELEAGLALMKLSWDLMWMVPGKMLQTHMSQRWLCDRQRYDAVNQLRDQLMQITGHRFLRAQERGEISPNVDIPMHLTIMDSVFLKAAEMGRFSKAERDAAFEWLLTRIRYLLQLPAPASSPIQPA